jgi:hypothetical protein
VEEVLLTLLILLRVKQAVSEEAVREVITTPTMVSQGMLTPEAVEVEEPLQAVNTPVSLAALVLF